MRAREPLEQTRVRTAALQRQHPVAIAPVGGRERVEQEVLPLVRGIETGEAEQADRALHVRRLRAHHLLADGERRLRHAVHGLLDVRERGAERTLERAMVAAGDGEDPLGPARERKRGVGAIVVGEVVVLLRVLQHEPVRRAAFGAGRASGDAPVHVPHAGEVEEDDIGRDRVEPRAPALLLGDLEADHPPQDPLAQRRRGEFGHRVEGDAPVGEGGGVGVAVLARREHVQFEAVARLAVAGEMAPEIVRASLRPAERDDEHARLAHRGRSARGRTRTARARAHDATVPRWPSRSPSRRSTHSAPSTYAASPAVHG